MPFTVGRGWISGFPPFQWLRWQETQKIQVFSRIAAGKGSCQLQIRRFSSPFQVAPMARNMENPSCCCWKNEHSPATSMIFVLRWPETQKNPRFFKDGCWKQEHSPANSTIFVDVRVSTNFGISTNLRLYFLLPTSAYNMCHLC